MTRLLMLFLMALAAGMTDLLAQCDGYAHVGTYYVDNGCAINGNGSSTTCGANGPFNSLANLQIRNGGYSGGNRICLKRGQTYRESFTFPSNGASGNHVVVDAWGAGSKPIVKGSNIFSNWSPFSGTTYQAAAPLQVDYLWKDGTFQNKGTGSSSLNNHEWYWASGTLYYREDENELSSHTVEGAVRAYGFSSSAKSYWDVNNIRFMHHNASTGYGLLLTSGSEFNVSDCEFVEDRGIWAKSANPVVITRTTTDGSHGGTYFGQLWMDGTTNATISNSVVRGGDSGGEPSLNVTSSASVNIYNSLFDKTGGTAIQSSSSGTVSVLNSILTGVESGPAYETVKNTGTGQLTMDYSLVLPSGRNGTAFLTGVNEGSHDIYSSPMFRSSSAKGYLVFDYDDTQYFKVFDEASRVADQYGYKIGIAAYVTGMKSYVASIPVIQDAINRGHWVSNHTYSHADPGVLTGFSLQYLGVGTSATMTIANSRLITNVTGASDNLNIDLTSPTTNTILNLCGFLQNSTGNKYSCEGMNQASYFTASINLADVVTQDIKTAPYAAVLDEDRYDTYEIDGADTYFKNTLKIPGGGQYHLDTFVYPYGNSAPPKAIAHLRNLNYLGARTTLSWLTAPNWRTSAGIDLFSIRSAPSGSGLGLLGYLWYSPNCTYTSGKSFVCNNISYSSSVYPSIQACCYNSAVFDGTSSYASSNDPSFDFHRGDGFWSSYVKVNPSAAKQTLFFQGTSDGDFHTLYISSSGSIVYSIVAGGSEKVHVETPAGLLSASQWHRVSLFFNRNTYKIYLDYTQEVSVFSTNRPGTYSGGLYIGATYSFSSRRAQDYYSGYLCWLSFGKENFAAATGLIEMLAAHGGVGFLLAHGDGEMPTPLLRILFEAAKASSANVMFDSFHNVVADLLANGTLGSDNRTVTWIQPDASDYHLLPNSPLINAGSPSGAPNTDFSGNSRVGNADIGIYEYQYRIRRSHSYWW